MLQFAKTAVPCLLASLFICSCKNDPKVSVVHQETSVDTVQNRPIPEEGTVVFQVTEGIINWAGKKSIGDGHQGTIAIEGGELLVNQNQLKSGKVTIDMFSISVANIRDAGERRDLESHLRDNDFFEAEKFPKAVFLIKEVLPSANAAFNAIVVGELTMKGKTNPVNVPVDLRIAGDKLLANSPTFPINRTQWGVNFRSGILGTTKDKLIDDNILLSLSLEARKR